MPLRVGLAGLGNAGFQVHGEVLRHLNGARLVAASDPVAGRRAEAERRYGCRTVAAYEELLALPEVELVTVATPHPLHHTMAIQALEAGKHVLVEKPMALDLGQASAMVEAARAAGRLLCVYQNWRYMPDLAPIRALIDAGAIGRPRRIETRFLWLPYRAMGEEPTVFSGRWQDSWNLRRGSGGGSLPMFGPHLIDQLLFALDYRPRRVYGVIQDIVGDDDYVQALFEDDDGVVAEVEINLAAFAGQKDRWFILGTEGVIAGGDRLCVRRIDEAEPRPVEVAADPRGEFVGSGERIYLNLRRAIREGAPLEIRPEQTLETMRVMDAIQRSACNRQPIDL